MVDRYGFCVKCGCNMQTEKVIDNKVQRVFIPDAREVEYLMSDGSRMRVSICKSCQEVLTSKNNDDIMDAVRNGWKEEMVGLNWTEERKQRYTERYDKLSIVERVK
jgi:hypothetical protein